MSEICTKCGLPKELCVCETIAKESQKIVVRSVHKKFGKVYTVVQGIDGKEIDLKELMKKLKNQLACGGTVKDGTIELQGEHRQHVRKTLIQSGFAAETIEVKG
jgi:translation initiation factor 1